MRFAIIALSALVLAVSLFSAEIDGKWTLETKLPGRDGGEGRTVSQVLNLKAEGTALTGSVTTSIAGREQSIEIKDGKIEGNKFSFTVVNRTRRGDITTKWEGTVEGDELKGTRSSWTGQQSVPFTAKRQ
jgi:hypothetical protein